MTLQSLFALGAAVGAITVPMIGDLKGKRAAIYLSFLCMIVGNLSLFFGILKSLYFVIGIGQILSALGSMAVATISYSLSSDYFSDDLRQKSIMSYCAAW